MHPKKIWPIPKSLLSLWVEGLGMLIVTTVIVSLVASLGCLLLTILSLGHLWWLYPFCFCTAKGWGLIIFVAFGITLAEHQYFLRSG